MRRRAFLGAAGASLSTSLAGCTAAGDLLETTNSRAPPLVENRPDAVYYPTHVEGMKVAGTGTADDLRVALFYSYPHRFWTVKKEDGEYVTRITEVDRDDAVHLMALPWDPETNAVVPDTGLSLEIARDGELVSQEVIYPMLSQRMGAHYGANFPLDGDGTYTVTVSVGGVSLARFGAYEGKFGDAASTDVAFEFSESTLNEIPYRLLEEKAGRRGAVAPMTMDGVPVGRAPKSLPGESLGTGTAGDVVFRGTVAAADRFGDDPYLAVSPRTPHNRLVVSGMSVSARVDGAKRSLKPGLDPELGFHYGASVEGLSNDADVRVAVDVPPQVARHEGYETAFLDAAATTLS
jgi:hypothetical protein